MVNYTSIKIRAETLAFMRQVFGPGEGIDKGIRRLLLEAGHVPGPAAREGKRVPRESIYRQLEGMKLGERALLHWRGEKNPATGAYWDTQQNWAFMAIARLERKTGFEFMKGDNGEGMILTRIK